MGSPVVRELNGKKYAIQQFQGKHADEYTAMEVDEEGKSNGIAQLFKRGLIQLSWREKDGVREGMVTIYENGLAIRKTAWDNLSKISSGLTGDGAEKVEVDKEDEIRMSFSNNIYAEMEFDVNSGKCNLVQRNNNTNTILYKGEGNDKLQKEGWGTEHDQDEKSRYYGYYIQNKLIHIHQEFLKDKKGRSVMIEYRRDERIQNTSNCLKQ